MGKKLTTEQFITRSTKKHNGLYNYDLVEYNGGLIKTKIRCSEHGVFEQTPAAHLTGQGCPICSNKNVTTDTFIEKAREKHSDLYDYSLVEYKKSDEKIRIICKYHGEFSQTPNNHLEPKGCPICGAIRSGGWSYSLWNEKGLKSDNFDGFKVYILKCWDDKESFYKIGKTYTNINKRYDSLRTLPYNWIVVKEIIGDSITISHLEHSLHSRFKDNTYIPIKNFKGKYECFSEIDLEFLSSLQQ
jgi:hypothetical protein